MLKQFIKYIMSIVRE